MSVRESFSWISARRVVGLLLPTLFVVACASQTPVLAPNIYDNPMPDGGPPQYILQVADGLSITFWGNPDLNTSVTVRPDGMITLPFIDEVEAAGKTPMELDAEITRLYESELAQPEVTVTVDQVASQIFYIGGAVRSAGLYDYLPPLTLFQAVTQAGGFMPEALRRQVILIRTMSDGIRYARSVDLMPVLTGENPALDVPLQAYDVAFVPNKKIIGFQTFVDQYIEPIYQAIPIRFYTTYRIVTQ